MPAPMFRAIARPVTPATPPTPPPAATPPTPATSATATPAAKKEEKKKKEKVGILERTMAPPSVARSLGTGAATLVGSILLLGLILVMVQAMAAAVIFGCGYLLNNM